MFLQQLRFAKSFPRLGGAGVSEASGVISSASPPCPPGLGVIWVSTSCHVTLHEGTSLRKCWWSSQTLTLSNAYLRAVDVKILQQLVVVNEGIEAVKWLLEERSTLTSRCSSLASSQYSLVESQEASRRGSWDSLQDPNDRLDSISVGSYLDTLADDMDEYSHNAAETAWPHVDLSPPGLPQEPQVANGKLHLEYDAHWRWLQSQDDVTFL
uniref:Leucine rich adaptor protein 1 n=1 Tax=Ficedula albicollis TaxID=59894 RepID=U3K4F5_FICAL